MNIDEFESTIIDVNGVRLHAKVGGRGTPLLLLHGWPQTWYAWHLMMPALAEQFTLVALDLRGSGQSDAPETGYDTGTLAHDALSVMRSLGHERFAVAGHDVGMGVAYALAADHPARVTHLIVAEALLPGTFPSPPFFQPNAANERLWHFSFNRIEALNEELVTGRENVFFSHMFTTKAATPDAIPQDTIDQYIAPIAADREHLRASFNYYRAIDESTEQNTRRRAEILRMPVLAVGGSLSVGAGVAATMRALADNVSESVLNGIGHYLPDEAPEQFTSVISDFILAQPVRA